MVTFEHTTVCVIVVWQYSFLYTVSLSLPLSVCLSPLPPLFIKQIKSLLDFEISVRGHGPQSGKQNTVQSHVYSLDYSLPPHHK